MRVKEQDRGSPGNKVNPLSERLSTIFSVTGATVLDELCIEFMKPIFRTARLHDDAKPTLKAPRNWSEDSHHIKHALGKPSVPVEARATLT